MPGTGWDEVGYNQSEGRGKPFLMTRSFTGNGIRCGGRMTPLIGEPDAF
jgi:hypothetical protein